MKMPNFVIAIKVKLKEVFCKHEKFETCKNQNIPNGYFFTIDKKCCSCGAKYIFRRKTTLSPWYRWSKA